MEPIQRIKDSHAIECRQVLARDEHVAFEAVERVWGRLRLHQIVGSFRVLLV